MKSVVVLIDRHPRSKRIGQALYEGACRMGWRAEVFEELRRVSAPLADLAVGYGWLPHADTLAAHKEAGRQYLHVDLGYWTRKRSGSDYGGHHKIALNDRHPTAYFRRDRPHDRLVGAPQVQPWRQDGRHILIAGLSAKGAISIGRQSLEWEREIITALRRITDRPLVYRPKPSWHDAQPIQSLGYSPATETINDALRNSWALVTNYSNAAIDALAAGIPIYAEAGVASALSIPSLAEIERPRKLSTAERRQFLADVGYAHWTRQEIEDGTMYRQFIDDGLIAA